MSWLPDKDPVLGDKHSCDALELIVIPRVRDLGDGFSVRRALPHSKRQMVGPFIFFDQMGPAVRLGPGRRRPPASPYWPRDRHLPLPRRVPAPR